jgi:hypothetical protein
MMDAVTALSVAAAAVQFVDFGTKIVSKTRQLHDSTSGALLENVEIEAASKRLSDMVTTLQTGKPAQGYSRGQTISPSDRILEDICQGCLDVSQGLIPRLEKLKVMDGSHRKWKSFRQALKSVWSKESIREIRERLVAYQAQLDTHTLLYLKSITLAPSGVV